MDKWLKLPVNVKDVGAVIGFTVAVVAVVAIVSRVPKVNKLVKG